MSGKKDYLSHISTKEGENGVFDAEENEGFGKGFGASKRGNASQRPDYRRVRKYYKSSKKYWEERNRRKQVLELSRQGLTGREIAKRLGVSDRTVKRDMSKIKPYYERLICSYWKKLEQDRKAEVEAQLEGKSLLEQSRLLGKMLAEQTRLLKHREYQRRQLKITIDLDELTLGYPTLKVCPQHPFSVRYPMLIDIEFVKDGTKQPAMGLRIGSETDK